MLTLLRTLNTAIIVVSFCLLVTDVSGQSQTPTGNDAYRIRGIQLLAEGKTADAIKQLKLATESNPNDAVAWEYLGDAYRKVLASDEALAAYERSIQLRPDHIPTRVALTSALFYWGDRETTVKTATEALSLDPKNAPLHFMRGETMFRQGNVADALKDADAALVIDPNYGNAWLLRSEAYLKLSWKTIEQKPELTDDQRKQYLRKTAESLEAYGKLPGSEWTAEYWRTQLESVRQRLAEYDLSASEQPTIYRANQVTQKVRSLTKPSPEYTEEARRAGEVGTVRISGVVNPEGKVVRIFVVSPLSAGLTAKAVAALKRAEFQPAVLEGKAVSQYLTIEYNFNIY